MTRKTTTKYTRPRCLRLFLAYYKTMGGATRPFSLTNMIIKRAESYNKDLSKACDQAFNDQYLLGVDVYNRLTPGRRAAFTKKYSQHSLFSINQLSLNLNLPGDVIVRIVTDEIVRAAK